MNQGREVWACRAMTYGGQELQRGELFRLKALPNDEKLLRLRLVAERYDDREYECGECATQGRRRLFVEEQYRDGHGRRDHKDRFEPLPPTPNKLREDLLKEDALESKRGVNFAEAQFLHMQANSADRERDLEIQKEDRAIEEETPIRWEKTQASMRDGLGVPELTTTSPPVHPPPQPEPPLPTRPKPTKKARRRARSSATQKWAGLSDESWSLLTFQQKGALTKKRKAEEAAVTADNPD